MSKGLKELYSPDIIRFLDDGGVEYLYTEKQVNAITRELQAFEIIKECLVSEFKLFEKDGEYFILFYFDEIHQLTFKLKGKEEYELLKEVLL